MDTTAIYTVMFSMIAGILLGGVFFAALYGALEGFRLPAMPGFKRRRKEKPPKKKEKGRRSSYFSQPGSPAKERPISPEEARQILSRQDRSNKYYVDKSRKEQEGGSNADVS